MGATWKLAFAALAVTAVAGCGAPGPGDEPPSAAAEGSEISIGEVLPNLAFEGVDERGGFAGIRLHDYASSGSSPAPLLVVQVSGGLWCGTCRWYAAHAEELASIAGAERLRSLHLIVGDRDNAPAGAIDARAWQSTFALEGTKVGADPTFRLGAVLRGRAASLPLFVLVDARTMRAVDALSNPGPDALRHGIEAAIATMDGRRPPPARPEALFDGILRRNDRDLLAETTLPEAPPPDPSNAVADSEAARRLGAKLFFDKGLSPSRTTSCATCHDPGKHLSDGRAIAEGAGPGHRRTPSIATAAHARWHFWDGRADSSWAQALAPLEDAREMASSRVFIARRIAAGYAPEFSAAFGREALPNTDGWPASGKPGDAAYEAMSATDREAATRVFVAAGKAIAAYERSFRVEPNVLDAYLSGDLGALDAEQKYGLGVFASSGCMQCHWGPRLTDDAFHATRIPKAKGDPAADRGRAEGLSLLRASEFRTSGRFSDARAEAFDRGDPLGDGSAARSVDPNAMLGKFKTPALRGVAGAAHFGHSGAFDALSSVAASYGFGGVPASSTDAVGAREPWIAFFGETAQWGLVPFLQTLTAELREPGAAAPR